MKIRLTKPVVQFGRIIPPGVILSNAPVEFMRKLVAEGRAERVDGAKQPDGLSVAPASDDMGKPAQKGGGARKPVATAPKGKSERKRAGQRKVTPDG